MCNRYGQPNGVPMTSTATHFNNSCPAMLKTMLKDRARRENGEGYCVCICIESRKLRLVRTEKSATLELSAKCATVRLSLIGKQELPDLVKQTGIYGNVVGPGSVETHLKRLTIDKCVTDVRRGLGTFWTTQFS